MIMCRRLMLAVGAACLLLYGSCAGALAAGQQGGTTASKAALQRQATQLATRVDRANRSVSRHLKAKVKSEERYEAALQAYSDHLRNLYIAGQTARVQLLLSAPGIDGAINAVSVIKQLAASDNAVLTQYRNAAQAEQSASSAYSDAQQQLADATASLTTTQSELANFQEPAQVTTLADLAQRSVPTKMGVGGDGQPPDASHFFTTSTGSSSLASFGGALTGGVPNGLRPLPLTPAAGSMVTQPSTMPSSDVATGAIQFGVASWYGPGFNGKHTADGETYNMYAMTAAHKTLPFGTWVKVTADNGRAVFVRINDRGPYVAGRIIDLSYAAAQALGIDGTSQVQIEVYAPPGAPVPSFDAGAAAN